MGNISSGKILNKSSDDEISQASEALLKLLIDSRKLKLSEKDFHSQMTTQAGMNDDQIQLLWHFLSNESTLDELITSDEYKFRDLEWRLEAKVRHPSHFGSFYSTFHFTGGIKILTFPSTRTQNRHEIPS